jgi:hypothetical protein
MIIIKEIPRPLNRYCHKPQILDSSWFILFPKSIIKLLTSSGSKGCTLSCGPFYGYQKGNILLYSPHFSLLGENYTFITSPIL